MWDGFNQRKFPRLSLKCEVRLNPEDSSRVIRATTENVGVGGICLLQDQALDRFSKCQIVLELSKEHPKIQCEGKVCWIIPHSQPLAKTTQYDTGIEFVGMKAETRDVLRQFIEDLQSRGFKDIA